MLAGTSAIRSGCSKAGAIVRFHQGSFWSNDFVDGVMKWNTLIARFETRRDAEVAVEHLVQQYGIERLDIFIQAEGAANSAGSKLAGADIESGHPGVEKRGDPALNAPIEVSVDCHGADVREMEHALK